MHQSHAQALVPSWSRAGCAALGVVRPPNRSAAALTSTVVYNLYCHDGGSIGDGGQAILAELEDSTAAFGRHFYIYGFVAGGQVSIDLPEERRPGPSVRRTDDTYHCRRSPSPLPAGRVWVRRVQSGRPGPVPGAADLRQSRRRGRASSQEPGRNRSKCTQ